MDYISRCEGFARRGCKVYVTSRKIESISDFKFKTIPLDVTSEKEGKIDVVVNNTGLLAAGTRIL
jgi:NADP-dependent 3-hydroxy acid dehydrogenase YdfG